jgi:hypothetical protein
LLLVKTVGSSWAGDTYCCECLELGGGGGGFGGELAKG